MIYTECTYLGNVCQFGNVIGLHCGLQREQVDVCGHTRSTFHVQLIGVAPCGSI